MCVCVCGGGGGEGGDQRINVGIIYRKISEDVSMAFRGFQGHNLPEKKFLKMRPSKLLEMYRTVSPTITTLFCIISNLLRSHQVDLFGSWGKLHRFFHLKI